MKFLLSIMLTFMFIGCGGDTTNTTFVTPYGDDNSTSAIAPVEIVSPPYGSGRAFDPYVINQNGVYKTNKLETFYTTNLLEEDCVLSIKPIGSDVYFVEVTDEVSYDLMPYDFSHGVWSVEAEDQTYLRVAIRTYQADLVEVYASCW